MRRSPVAHKDIVWQNDQRGLTHRDVRAGAQRPPQPHSRHSWDGPRCPVSPTGSPYGYVSAPCVCPTRCGRQKYQTPPPDAAVPPHRARSPLPCRARYYIIRAEESNHTGAQPQPRPQARFAFNRHEGAGGRRSASRALSALRARAGRRWCRPARRRWAARRPRTFGRAPLRKPRNESLSGRCRIFSGNGGHEGGGALAGRSCGGGLVLPPLRLVCSPPSGPAHPPSLSFVQTDREATGHGRADAPVGTSSNS